MRLALDGGRPVRTTMLPYGRQAIDDQDLRAVADVLQSDWLTTGPTVGAFENAFARTVDSTHAVAVSNGTAALHASTHALGIGPGDEVIVPTMTFAATANCVVYQGARPVFADVEADTLLLSIDSVVERFSDRTKAVIAVDFAGHPAEYSALDEFVAKNGIPVIADCSHALGAEYRKSKVGSIAMLSTFSFHPVKHITAGEGGMVSTCDEQLVKRMTTFRNHGIEQDSRTREAHGTWAYEMTDLGYNYRLSDIHCALGLSQLTNLNRWLARRREIAKFYDGECAQIPGIEPLFVKPHVTHAYHLYIIRLNSRHIRCDRNTFYAAMRAEGIGVNVHYSPVHLHPYYRRQFATKEGDCPIAEDVSRTILSLPMFASMSDEDATDVVTALEKVARAYAA